MSAAIYKFLHLMLDYLEDALNSQRSDLVLVGSFLLVYGVIELLLAMGFQDYNYIQTQLENKSEPVVDEQS